MTNIPQLKIGLFLVIGTDNFKLASAAVNQFKLAHPPGPQEFIINGKSLTVVLAREAH
jgi:hypothetical protein